MTGRSRAGRPPGRPARVLPLAWVLAAVVLLSAPALALGPAPRPAVVVPVGASLDWSTQGGSDNRSGYTPVDGPGTPGVLGLVQAYGVDSPAIRAGVVANLTRFYAADAFGNLVAYNRSTAAPTELWNATVGSGPVTPALAGNVILDAGSDGLLREFQVSNGFQRWEAPIGGAAVGGIAVETTDLGSIVIVGDSAGAVTAFNLSRGTADWTFRLNAPLAGAPAVEGSTLVAATGPGWVEAYDITGATPVRLWNVSINSTLSAGAALSTSTAFLGDRTGNVTALALSNGSELWRTSLRPLLSGDTIYASPAVGDGAVFLATQLGDLVALDQANGTIRWNRTAEYTGFLALASPSIAPNGVYFSDASQFLVDLNPSNGTLIWSYTLDFTPAYGTPAIDNGAVLEGTDLGYVIELGNTGGPPTFGLSGTVVDAGGAPVDGAQVNVGGYLTDTNATGEFRTDLPNGSYSVTVSAAGFYTNRTLVRIQGAPVTVTVVLVRVPRAWVHGFVVDASNGRGLDFVNLTIYGSGLATAATTDSAGAFAALVPIGADSVYIGGAPGFGGANVPFVLTSAGLTNLTVGLPPVVVLPDGLAPYLVAAPLAALVGAAGFAAAYGVVRRRKEEGQPTGLLGPFGRFVAMKATIVPAQAGGVLAILYAFGTVLPAIARGTNPCKLMPAGYCPTGAFWSWGNAPQALEATFVGLFYFLWNMFTLNWGYASFGYLSEPATTFLAWWLPDSLQLALFALPISALLAWVVGLYGGARRDGAVDVGARILSAVGLLVPSFLLVLLFLGTFYQSFDNWVGDSPFGIVPSANWWVLHGGLPPWIGEGDNTLPTGLPLIDGALHGDWSFERVVLLKVVWQALAIAVVYTAIFLRYARSVVADAFQEPHLVAARARGLDEPTLLWRHTGRRVLPVLLLVFGVTLPAYVGTQAVVEALANDNGMGTLLLGEMTHVGLTGFGFSALGHLQIGNLYQVTIFLLVLLVLLGNLSADVLAAYLDPRIVRRGS